MILAVWIGGFGLYVHTESSFLKASADGALQVIANLLALAAVCPFVGSLSDLMGRRYVALIGASFLILGMIVSSTAHTMNVFICAFAHPLSQPEILVLTFAGGMTLAGVGAGINELTALAATSELAPTRKRGKYVAVLIFTIIPFCPSVLWGQLIASHAGWRYCGALCGAWAAVGFLMTLFFYFPPPRVNSRGLTRKQVIEQIDFVGGFLSIVGMILFMAGLQWGGYQVSSNSPFTTKIHACCVRLSNFSNNRFSTRGGRLTCSFPSSLE